MLPERSNSSETSKSGPELRVVAIGGGTGLSTLLKGLKQYVSTTAAASVGQSLSGQALSGQALSGQAFAEKPSVRQSSLRQSSLRHPSLRQPTISELSGVVTVSDNGGSSGRLRSEFNMLPPGDIRNCIVALSEDEALLSRLFQHRFQKGSGLEGHNFGNLFLAALTSITGDFAEAVRLSSEILLTRGHIYPATMTAVELEALFDDGTRVLGETQITASKGKIKELFLVPPDVQPMPQTLEAIANADLITIGPGSLFTSLIPNLLVRGIPEAVSESSAVKVFICNLMTQANESLGLTAADHIRALNKHASVQLFDYAMINQTPASEEMLKKYAAEEASQIVVDSDAIEALGVCPIMGDYLDAGLVARHATDRIAHDLMALMAQSPERQAIRR